MDVDRQKDGHVLLDVAYQLPEGEYPGFRLDESLRIVSMSPNSAFMWKFCIYDQIESIDGISPSCATEATALLQRSEISIYVKLWRSKYIDIISYKRQKHIGLKRKEGYGYFLAFFQKGDRSLGFSINNYGSTTLFYVTKIERYGMARKVLQVGDFLRDYDGETMSKHEFKRHLVNMIHLNGRYCVIVERAVDMQTRVMLMNTLRLKAPEIIRDPEMALDCREIASRQIQYHMMNKTFAPKPILTKKTFAFSKTIKKEKNKTEETSDTVTEKTNATNTGEDDEELNTTINNNPNTVTTESVVEEEPETGSPKITFKPEQCIAVEEEIGTDAKGPLQKVGSLAEQAKQNSSSTRARRSRGLGAAKKPQSSLFNTNQKFSTNHPIINSRYELQPETLARVKEEMQREAMEKRNKRR